MSQYIDERRSQKLKDAIDNNFSAWKAVKTDPMIAGSVLTDICMPFYAKNRGELDPKVVDYAIVRLIEYCHLIVQNNVIFPKSQHTRVMVLLCTMEGWKVFAREQEDYLLASLILSTPAKHEHRDLDVTLITTVSQWCGCILDADNYNWEGDNTEVAAAQFREDVGRYLFGDSWYALYHDELTGSFKEAYKAILGTKPDFIFKRNNKSTVPTVDVPHDF